MKKNVSFSDSLPSRPSSESNNTFISELKLNTTAPSAKASSIVNPHSSGKSFSQSGSFRGDGYGIDTPGSIKPRFKQVINYENINTSGQTVYTFEEEKAAITIQASFRGYRVRKIFSQKKEQLRILRESMNSERTSLDEQSPFRSYADSLGDLDAGVYIPTPTYADPHIGLLGHLKHVEITEGENMIRAGRNYLDKNITMSNRLLDPEFHVVLLLGGFNPQMPHEFHLLGSCVYVYVVEKNKWFFGGTLPEPRAHHAAVLVDGRIYVIGGLSPCIVELGEPIATRTVFQLDVKANRWHTKMTMNQNRAYHGICHLNKQIVVFGGKDDRGRILSTVEAYDIERNQWSVLKSLPKALMGMAVAVLDNTIYLIGGITFEMEKFKLSSDVFMYNTKNPGWFVKCQLPEPQAFSSAATIRREIWLFGGLKEQPGSNGGLLMSSDTVYTLTSMDHPRWVNFGEKLSLPKHSMAITKIMGQKIFLMGGISSQSREAVKENDIFDRETLRMYDGLSLPQATTGSVAISLLPDSAEKLLRRWGGMTIPEEVRELAAMKIQACYRGHRIRIALNKMRTHKSFRGSMGGGTNPAFEHKRQSRQGMKFAASSHLHEEFSMYKTVNIRQWPPAVDPEPSASFKSESNLVHLPGYVTQDLGNKDQGKRYVTLSLDCDPNLGAVPQLDDAIRKNRKVLGLKRWEPNPYGDLKLSDSEAIRHDWLPIVLILGGLKLKEPSNYAFGRTVLEYNPVTNTFKFAGKMPQPRNHHAVCYMDGVVYVSGGYDPHLLNSFEMVATNTLFALKIAMGEWTEKKPMLSSRAFHALVPYQGKLYALGGRNEVGRLVASIECFNPTTNEWSLMRPLPTARMGMAAVVFDKQIWCMGGIGVEEGSSDLNVLTSVMAYDPANNTWKNCPPLRCPRAFGTCVNVKKAMWLCAGCCRMKDERNLISMASIDHYNISEGAWERCTILSNPRHCAAITAVEECIYFFGGMTSQEWGAQPHTEMLITEEHTIYDCKDPPHAVTGAAAVTIPARSPSLRCESLSNLLDFSLRKV